ncbi:MAG: threonylcarbamoyl-AMP synthase [Candidatus Omnitrophica bacterium]|nr:threonylcarbamoyl-AMP synthase [Candidatus Omnitrophota bacterium]MCB9720540.1 threonylcarbamoyl-AMP synthase [Candidatus Omnitrophota bacterium]
MKTEILTLHPEFPEPAAISKGASIIRNGGLVVFPTETVYGIAADFANPDAVARLRKVKNRAADKPLTIMISQPELISNYTRSHKTLLYKLIYRYWPGPLTVVVESRDPGRTVGVRVPDHEIARRLVAEVQTPVAVPSANLEGKPAPRTLQEALVDLDGQVDLAIDGGETEYGQGSTVVDVTSDQLKVLREGVIPAAEIQKMNGLKTILFVCTGNSCRSVMAHYLLQHLVRDKPYIEVCSAGTSVFLQSKASADTLMVLGEKGIDASGHLSQPINTILLRKADLIFVMTRAHRQQVLERMPEVEKRVYLLKEFAAEPGSLLADLDIPDPIGRDRSEYQFCMSVIEQAVQKVVGLL